MEVLNSHHINSDYVAIVDGKPSGNAIIFVDKTGANSITVFPGANRYVKLNSTIAFEKKEILVAQFEVNMEAVEFYFKLAKAKEVYTILNPSPMKPLLKKLLMHTDLIVVNELEAYEISVIEIDGYEAAVRSANMMLEAGVKAVVITLGKEGAVVVDENGSMQIPGYSVEVVDTQGAGDVFLGTLVAELAFGKALYEAATFANMAACLSVTKAGSTQMSMPSFEDITNLRNSLTTGDL
jgi:ribokinase